MNNNFTVAISVYKNDNPEYFRAAIYSIYQQQTIKPSEIVLVEDGPISMELKAVIKQLKEEIPVIKIIAFSENRGHAAARQAGLEHSTNDLIAIMDADDIADSRRFELTLKAFEQYPEATAIGGNINEFIGTIENVIGCRRVPKLDEDIKEFLKSRCPMNFVTVMYKKNKVQEAGGFIDWYCEEDYFLWIRLTLAGHKFYNIQKNLVNVRVGEDMYSRRGGWRYFKSESQLQKYMLDHHIINMPKCLYNIAIRFIVQVLMPNWLRGIVFRVLARS